MSDPRTPQPPEPPPHQGHGDAGSGPSAVDPEVLAATRRGVLGLLGVETLEANAERVVMRLSVDDRVHQPYGLLHGGVSALLAETAASFGADLASPPGHAIVGIEINASHLRAMREGVLVAVATPLRTGRRIHVWDVALSDGAGRPVCRARCTLAIREPIKR